MKTWKSSTSWYIWGKKAARLGGGTLGICDVIDTWENHIALGKGVSELHNDLKHSN